MEAAASLGKYRDNATRGTRFLENYNFLTIDVQGYELEVLKGSRETLTNISGILTEVNRDELYSNCVRVEQLDDFLKNFNFYRVETNWEGGIWGDAFYLKK